MCAGESNSISPSFSSFCLWTICWLHHRRKNFPCLLESPTFYSTLRISEFPIFLCSKWPQNWVWLCKLTAITYFIPNGIYLDILSQHEEGTIVLFAMPLREVTNPYILDDYKLNQVVIFCGQNILIMKWDAYFQFCLLNFKFQLT